MVGGPQQSVRSFMHVLTQTCSAILTKPIEVLRDVFKPAMYVMCCHGTV